MRRRWKEFILLSYGPIKRLVFRARPGLNTTISLSDKQWKRFLSFLDSIKGASRGERIDRFASKYDFNTAKAIFSHPAADEAEVDKICGIVAQLSGKTYVKPTVPLLSARDKRVWRKELLRRQQTGVDMLVKLVDRSFSLFIDRELFLQMKKACQEYRKG